LYTDWFSAFEDLQASGLNKVNRNMQGQLSRLDPALLKQLIVSHRKAIAGAQTCSATATNPELASFCQAGEATATQHLQILMTYTDQCYPDLFIGGTP
jgi:hypothetical protein